MLGLDNEVKIETADTDRSRRLAAPAESARQDSRARCSRTARALFDSPVILEYLDHLAGGGKIIPKDADARFAALTLQALCDGILDASILLVYEGRWRPAERHEQKWLDHQAGKVDARARRRWKPRRPALDRRPDVGQITLACALGYRDLRFGEGWRKDHPRLVAWLDGFAAKVPAFAATKPG